MRTFLKYLLTIVTVFILIFLYFRYTESGQKNAYSIFSFYASHKLGIPVKIKDIHINQLSYVKANAILDEQYQVNLQGFIKNKHMDLRYTLHSDCFKNNICTFDDIIKVSGEIKGWGNHLKITGKGKALDGNVTYHFIKEKEQFKNIHLKLNDTNSSKLFTLLGEEAFFKGKSNVLIDFDVISEEYKFGSILYDVKENDFYGLPIEVKTKININNDIQTFYIDLNSTEAHLHISEGVYNEDENHAEAKYTLDIQDLSHFKEILKEKYTGSFHTSGKIEYSHNDIKIKGISTDFGGKLHFSYHDKKLHLDLDKLSLKTLMKTANIQAILDANITGRGIYDITNKEAELKTKLHHARLLSSPLLGTIEKKLSLPLENEIFNNSSFDFKMKNDTVSSNLTLANKNMHLILKDTTFSTSGNDIQTHIDLRIPKHSIKGKLYLRTNNIKENPFQDIYLAYTGSVEKHYNVKLNAMLSESFINITYTLNAKRLPGYLVTIVDDINLSGFVSGPPHRLHISAEGLAMEGKVNFTAIKQKEHFEDVSISFQDIHTLKLFTLLGKPDLPNGKADLNASFTHLSHTKIDGYLDYTLRKGRYKTLPLSLNTKVNIDNKKVTFSSNIKLSTADINLSRGIYLFDTNASKVFYTVSTNNLTPLEPLIGKYLGAFNTTGTMTYDKDLQIRGLSQTFGGMVDFLYKKDMLYIDLEDVSLTRFMNLFDYPHMIKAQINGNINYDFTKEQLLLRADLNNTRFLKSDLVHTIFKKSGINMLKEVFPQTTLFAIYQNNILAGDLILKSKQSHFYVKNMQLNTKENTVNAHFDLRMQGQEFSGRVYGSLQNPKVKLNLKKLIRYQMDKQMDSMMGKGNRELMESMPMGGTAKDMATDVGAGFMEIFF